jgi:hypothetical protein
LSVQPNRKKDEPEEGTFGRLKSIKILDKALMAFGGRRGRDVKFVLKDLSKPEHHTMVMRVKDARTLEFDLHLTHEGSHPVHEPIVKVELDMRQWEKITEEQAKKIVERAIEKVDVDNPDPSIAGGEYLPIHKIFQGSPSARRLEITRDNVRAGFGNETMTLNQFMASKESAAVVFREHKRALEVVFRSDAGMYLVNYDRMMNGMLKLLGFDKVEKAIEDALKAHNEMTQQATWQVLQSAMRAPAMVTLMSFSQATDSIP